MTAAFAGAEAVFLLMPPFFDPAEGFPEVRAVIAAMTEALRAVRPGRVVFLSTIGAQVRRPNLLNQLGMVEDALRRLDLPVAFLRAAWFVENAAWDVAAAHAGGIASFLQPVDRPIPMVATRDIASRAAELLCQSWQGVRVEELAAATAVSPADLAAGFAEILGHAVTVDAVPRAEWEANFRAQGMQNPTPRIQMLDGFNAGWLEFEGTPRPAPTPAIEVLRELVARSEG